MIDSGTCNCSEQYWRVKTQDSFKWNKYKPQNHVVSLVYKETPVYKHAQKQQGEI